MRLERLTPDLLDEEQSTLYSEIAEGPRAQGPQHFALRNAEGALNGPFNAFLLSPALGRSLQALGAAVRYETDLTGRIRELAILAVAASWNSAFERLAHEGVGRAAGLTDDELAAVRDGREPATLDATESAALRLTRALLAGDVSDAEWTAFADSLGAPVIFELSTLVGYYATLALQLRIFRVDEPGTSVAPATP